MAVDSLSKSSVPTPNRARGGVARLSAHPVGYWAFGASDTVPIEREVVGVAASLKARFLDEAPPPHVYEPLAGRALSPAILHVRLARTDRESESRMLRAVGAAIRAADPDLPVIALKTLREHRDSSHEMWLVNVAADVFGLLGGMALAMAGIGRWSGRDRR